MARQIQIRRGTTSEHENFTGAIGEITMDTDAKTLRVHDGETIGGIALARASDIMGDYVIETQLPTAENNYTWYRKYKSGWIEQGQRTTTVAGQITTFNLPQEMSDSEYIITATAHLKHSGNAASINFVSINAKDFSAWANIFGTTGYHAVPFSWFVSGMSA